MDDDGDVDMKVDYDPFDVGDPVYEARGSSDFIMKSIKVIVIHAGFGDATLLEVSDHKGLKKHFLIDGGPTDANNGEIRYWFFENVIETLLQYTSNNSNVFKCDGIMVTHPDDDHTQGVMKLFNEFLNPSPGNQKFEIKGPLLLTKAFEHYQNYIDVIYKAQFEGLAIHSSFPIIKDFVNQFVFYFPEAVKYGGVVYTHSPNHFKKPNHIPSFINDKNATSTLLIVEDTNNPQRPLVSLNGDAYGGSILKSLNSRHPIVFKVPHHGSAYNSHPDLMTLPVKCDRIIAFHVLLEAAITKVVPVNYKPDFFTGKARTQTRHYSPLDYDMPPKELFISVSEKFTEYFCNKMKRKADCLLSSVGDFINGLDREADLDSQLYQLQNAEIVYMLKYYNEAKRTISDKLKRSDNVTQFDYFLTKKFKGKITIEIEKFIKDQINEGKENKLQNNKDIPGEIKKFLVNLKTNIIKNRVLNVFTIVEKQHPLAQDMNFAQIRSFYIAIRADVYFISSGDMHDHPHWEVINGIIAAACEIRKEKSYKDYCCSILLTSGNHIQGEELIELKGVLDGDDWRKYVFIYFFDEFTPFCEIDPNNIASFLPIDPNNIASSSPTQGILPWNDILSPETNRKLETGYKNVFGAKQMKIKRETKGGFPYEIQPIENSNLWLGLDLDHSKGIFYLVLKEGRESFDVKEVKSENFSIMDEKYLSFELELKFGFGSINVVICKDRLATCRDHTPCVLYIKNEGTGLSFLKFNVNSAGHAIGVQSQKEATIFVIHKATLIILEATTLQSLPKPTNEKTITTKEFLQYISHKSDIITCQQLLNVSVSHNFTSKLLLQSTLGTDLRDFLIQILNFSVDYNSSFIVADSQLVSANVVLVLPEKMKESLKYKNDVIAQVSLSLYDLKTIYQKVTLEMSQKLTSPEIITVDLTQFIEYQKYVQSFPKYLKTFLNLDPPDKLKVYDAVSLLLQSEFNGYVYMSNIAQAIVGLVLEWNVNYLKSTVQFLTFPSDPVLSAHVSVDIPSGGAAVTLTELVHPLCVTEVDFILPEKGDMYVSIHGTINNIQVSVTCSVLNYFNVPEIDVKLVQLVSLDTVADLLQLGEVKIENFLIPLVSKSIKDVIITDFGFTLKQSGHQVQSSYLTKVSCGVEFNNIDKYLPPCFSNLKSVSSRVVVLQPKNWFTKISFEVNFNFCLQVSKGGEEVPLLCQFSTHPVNASHEGIPNSYNFTLLIQTDVQIGSTIRDSISLNDFLTAFGLQDAVGQAQAISLLHSLLNKVELKSLLLGMNSVSKSINSFALDLTIVEWKLTDNIVINTADISVAYIDKKWSANFETRATLCDEYLAAVQIQLCHDSGADLKFTSFNDQLTLSKYLEIFSLGQMSDTPVVGQLLDISIIEASLSLNKSKDGRVTFNEGTISLYVDTLKINTQLCLSDVSIRVGFTLNKDKYVFSFAVKGFINNKMYINVEYDHTTLTLSGFLSTVSFKKASLTEVVTALIADSQSIDQLSNDDLFKGVSSSPSVHVSLALKYDSTNFVLNHFVIQIENKLKIDANLSLTMMKFGYQFIKQSPKEQSEHHLVQKRVYALAGELVSKDTNTGAILEFNLTTLSTGKKTIIALIKPSCNNKTVTLKSLLHFLGESTLPEVPIIEGHNLPSFFDISFTEGQITLSLPSFDIEAFQLNVQTTHELIILDSPLIKLKHLSLKVDYDKSAETKTTAVIIGHLTLGNIHLTLEGRKEKEGTVFKLASIPSNDTTDYQQVITTLTPIDAPNSVTIPTNIGLPKELNYTIVELIVKLLHTNKEKSFNITCISKLDWNINLGFQKLIVKELGGSIFFLKDIKEKQYTVSITGQFQFTSDILMSSQLKLGSQTDSVLNITATDPNTVKDVPTITDKLLGFHNTFDSLLPDTTQSLKLLKCSLCINFTKEIFGLVCECNNGTGVLIAGNFSSDKTAANYGYAFGVSFPQGFKFSLLLSALAPIDNILTIQKANCIIVNIDKVKVDAVVSKIKSATEFFAIKSDSFMDLKLDDFTKEHEMTPGMSLYCELDFSSLKNDTLLSRIYKIAEDNTKISNTTITSFINKDPIKSVFKATIDNFTLLGLMKFSQVSLVYSPSTPKIFQLDGCVSFKIDDKTLQFVGQFTFSDTQSKFTVSSQDADKVVANPLGMNGITLEKVELALVYNYPKDSLKTRATQKLTGVVKFHAFKQQSENMILNCDILFIDFKPSVVQFQLEPSRPLTISDLIATVFNKDYDITKYINIGFVKGRLYYAKLDKDSDEIDGAVFKCGFHITSDIVIFSKPFTIEADILPNKSEICVKGYSQAPFNFGFGKLTGVDDSDNNKVIENKGPMIVFKTNPNATSISLEMGLILLKETIGSVVTTYQYEGGIKKFIGTLTYQHSIGFIKNPSITFEWSQENGFQINNWKAIGPIPNFIENVLNYKDTCGTLVDMVMKDGIHTKFNINMKITKPSDSSKSMADIEITGTYDVLLVNKVHIASVPFPDLPPLILPKQDNITLQGLPQYIMKFFAINMTAIVEQIIHHPERLAKIIGLVVLKQLAKKYLKTLFCRNVKVNNFDPEQGGEDPTDGDTEDTKTSEDNFEKLFEDFLKAVEGAASAAGDAAGAAAGAAAAGEGLLDTIGGILAVLGLILSVFGMSAGLQEKKKKLEDKQEKIKNKLKAIDDKMKKLLDISQEPIATFTPPNKLHVQWNSIKDAQYHVKVFGNILSDGSSVDGQIETRLVVFYEETISTNQLPLDKDEFYNVITLKVSVNATIDGGHGHIYNGQVYTVNVHNVHPTLHPPTDLYIKYSHSAQQICLTANPALHGGVYSFELIDANKQTLHHLQYKQPADSKIINCTFPHTVITLSSIAPFKVSGKSLGKVNTSISSSIPVESNALSIVSPINDLQLTLPHFGDEKKLILLQWKLPLNTDKIKGVTCQIIDTKKTIILMTKDYFSSGGSSLPTNGSFKLTNLVSELEKHEVLHQSNSKPVHVMIQVCTVSNTEGIIDSVYVSKSVSSLLPPKNVTFHFQLSNSVLEVNWDYEQESTDYGIQIKDHKNSQILLSKQMRVKKDPKITPGKVGIHIPLSELKDIDSTLQYSIQVTSISSENDTFDSLCPSEPKDYLKLLEKPVLKSYMYVYKKDSISVSFAPTKNTDKYFITLKRKEEVIYSLHSKDTTVVIAMNTIIGKLQPNDALTCSVSSMGSDHVTSLDSVFTNNLVCMNMPTNFKCEHKANDDTIILSCNMPSDAKSCIIGFINGESNIISHSLTNTDPGNTNITSFQCVLLRKTNIKKWKSFVQTSLIKDSDSHLPSPMVFLSSDFIILDTPSIVSCSFKEECTVLNTVINPIDNAGSYKLTCNVNMYSDNNALSLTVNFKDLHPNKNNELVIDLASKFNGEEWLKRYFPMVTQMTLTLIAEGTTKYLSSKPSTPIMIKRKESLTSQLVYKYKPEDDILSISCKVKETNTTVSLGVMNGDNSVTKQVKSKNETVSVTLSGQEIRTKFDNCQINVFAQTIQDGCIPSKKLTSPDHLTILNRPQVTHLSYNITFSNLKIELSEPATSDYQYMGTLIHESKKKKETLVIKPLKDKETIVMKYKFHDWSWEVVLEGEHRIILLVNKIASADSGYINSKASARNIIGPPMYFTTFPDGNQITVKWNSPSSKTNHSVSVSGACVDFTADYYSSSVVISSLYFLLPLRSIQYKTVFISLKAQSPSPNDDSCNDEIMFSSYEENIIKSPLIAACNNYIGSGLKHFDNGLKVDGKAIIGINELRIQYSNVVNSIQIVYRLTDGSTHTTPVYGVTYHDYHISKTEVIKLSNDEYIVGYSAAYSSAYYTHLPNALGNLVLIITNANGVRTKYGPFGNLITSKIGDTQIEDGIKTVQFYGLVVSLMGTYDDHIRGLGFHYVPISQEIFTSLELGWSNSSLTSIDRFNDNIVSPLQQLTSLQITYDDNTVYSILPFHSGNQKDLKDLPDCQGIKKESIDLTKQDLIGIKCHFNVKDQKLCHVSFNTQLSGSPYKNSTIHGPYASKCDTPQELLQVKGKIMGFYGHLSAQNTISSLGVSYSLISSELFGGTHGTYINDRHYNLNIAAIKKISSWNSWRGIYSFQVVYILSDGSTFEGPMYGGAHTGPEISGKSTFDLEEGEEIITMSIGKQILTENKKEKGETENEQGEEDKENYDDFIIGSFQFTTIKKDGTIKKSEIFGNSHIIDKGYFQANGPIVSFFGRSSDSSVNALGVYYTSMKWVLPKPPDY